MDIVMPVEARTDGLAGIRVLIVLSQCLVGGDVALMTVSLVGIGLRLHILPSELQWILSASYLTFGGFLVLGGRLVDVNGARRMFVLGSGLFALGLIFGVVSNLLLLIIAGRVLVGLGGAMLCPATIGLIVDQFAVGSSRDKAFGLYSIGQGAGFFGGMVVGGLVLAAFGWHGTFALDFLLAAGNLLLGLAVIPRVRTAPVSGALNLPGAIAVTIGMGLTVYGLSSIGKSGIAAPQVWIGLVGGVLVLLCFVAIERRSSNPLLEFSVFRAENMTISFVLNMLINGISLATFVTSLLYVQRIGRLAPASMGLVFLPALIITIITARLVPVALRRFSSRAAAVMTFALYAVLLVPILANGYAVTSSAAAFVIALVIVVMSTIGVTTGVITMFAEATGNASPLHRGVVSAILLALAQIGAALGIACSASTLSMHAPGALENFRLTYFCIFVLAMIASALAASFFRYHLPRDLAARH